MGNRLYVGNLSFQATVESIRSAFAPFGEVGEIHIPSDRETGQPRGFAFVTMGNSHEAAKAIAEMNGAMTRREEAAVFYCVPDDGQAESHFWDHSGRLRRAPKGGVAVVRARCSLHRSNEEDEKRAESRSVTPK
jgi:RNA recognition motif-containing protein